MGNDGEKNPYTMSLTGQTDGSVIPVTKGTPLTLTTNDPSHSGEGYTINYKVVMEADGSRFLMDYGVVDTVNPAGTETQIAIPTADCCAARQRPTRWICTSGCRRTTQTPQMRRRSRCI